MPLGSAFFNSCVKAQKKSLHRVGVQALSEGLVDHGAVARPLELGAHERAALARLDVLELDDLVDDPIDLDVGPVLELVGADHGSGG